MATESSSSTCRQLKKTKQPSHSPLSTDDSLLLPLLPPEIIFEVLSRLPVKSLLRFKCVSKSWRSLISQPEFVKAHHSLASMNTDYTHHRLILSNIKSNPRTEFKSCSLYSVVNEKSDTAVELDCPLKVSHSTTWVVGCCYGLVCIAAGKEISIWNPSSRKSKRLPDVEMVNLCLKTYGFGYDESVDDFKVVGFFLRNPWLEVEVFVYTLRTDSWRRIKGFLGHLPPHGSKAFVSGALHWFSRGNGGRVIVSFDLLKETFGEVAEPDYQDGSLHRACLDALNGCLCIFRTYKDFLDVWVMKEYGTRESWTKLVVIPYVSGPYYNVCFPLLWTLKIGEVLLGIQTQLIRYNPKDGTFSYPKIRNWSSCFIVHSYVESLFSPDIDAESGVQWQQLQLPY